MNTLDPMGFARGLNCMADYYPLGFPLRLWSNSALVMDAAAAAWESFPAVFRVPPMEVHALVENIAAEPPTPPDYRGREHLWMIMGRSDAAVCDHERRFAFCRLSDSTARDTAFTAYYYLEAIAFHLLTQLYVTPVHAACVTRGGAGMLLCGDSGAGKTSLAYACAKQNWCYVSDNESWLLRDGEERIALGNPRRIRFRDNAVDLFPELRTRRPFLFANGKMSVAVEMSGRPEVSTAFQANISHLVFLDRGGSAGMRAVSKEEAFEKLLGGVPAYSTAVRAQHEASLRRLVRAETVRISYDRLEEGVVLLDTLAERA
jgi:hypothetical protein